ncbi:MAG: hypothetical protein HXY51_16525 [Nitrospirae bacterium]|nr:hypothetical protein [Nitrospirota bacterium]
MPNCSVRVRHTAILGLLLLLALAVQGCLGIVWLGAMGIDRARTSDIEFQAFENSWVAAPHERQRLGLVQSIVVMPFAGDPVMAERWAAVFRDMTDLRVVSPSDATRYGVSEHGQIGLAQRTRVESRVDYVLIGNVAGQEPVKSFAGLKESSSQRLYLYLMNDSGALLWKTELSYTIVKGAKDLDEAMVTRALLTHVRAHANELGLAELGTRN